MSLVNGETTPHMHVWMPPRPGGIDALAAMREGKRIRLPGGVTTDPFVPIAGTQPAHRFTGRWCLIGGEPHPEGSDFGPSSEEGKPEA